MRYPLALSSHKRIVIASEAWFSAIGKVDQDQIEISISRQGEKSLAWFLDADGFLFELEWQGKLAKSLVQWLGLTRQRERYSIRAPRTITAAELLERIADHKNQFEEAPHTDDLRKELLGLRPEAIINQEFMLKYLGQEPNAA